MGGSQGELGLLGRTEGSVVGEERLVREDPRELGRSCLLSRMGEIEISKREVAHLEKLFESDYAGNLTRISLNWMRLDLCLPALSHNPHLTNVKLLSLAGAAFSEDALHLLLRSPLAKNLESLDLSWTDISNATLAAMADSPQLNALRCLKLARCSRVSDKGFLRYFGSAKAGTLGQVDLRSTLVTNATLEALFGSKHLKNLAVVTLRSCPNIKDSGFRDYFRGTSCAALKELDVGWSKLGAQLFAFMAASKRVTQLHTLRAGGLKAIENDLCRFVESPAAASLTLLDLSYSDISCKLLLAIASSRYLNSLEELEIKGYELSEGNVAALSALVRSTNTSKLKSLKLARGKGEGLEKLLQGFAQYMGKIEQLCVVGLTEDELERWRKTLRKCAVSNRDSSPPS